MACASLGTEKSITEYPNARVDFRAAKCFEKRVDDYANSLRDKVMAQLALPEEQRSDLGFTDAQLRLDMYDYYLELLAGRDINTAGLCQMCKDARVPFMWFFKLRQRIQAFAVVMGRAALLLARLFLQLFPLEPIPTFPRPINEAPRRVLFIERFKPPNNAPPFPA